MEWVKGLQKAIDYIEDHITEDIDYAEIAKQAYSSSFHKERWCYLKKLDMNHSLLSLEGFTDSEGNVLDFVVDEAVDVAETVVYAKIEAVKEFPKEQELAEKTARLGYGGGNDCRPVLHGNKDIGACRTHSKKVEETNRGRI